MPDIATIVPDGAVSRVKTEDADLGKVVEILKDANFHGYVALEYEAKEVQNSPELWAALP